MYRFLTIIVARFSLRDLEAASTVLVFYPARSVTLCDQIHAEFEYRENSIVLFWFARGHLVFVTPKYEPWFDQISLTYTKRHDYDKASQNPTLIST